MDKQSQARCIAHEIRNQISICELYSQIIKRNLEKEGIKNNSINNALNCITKSLKIAGNNLLDLKSLDNFEFKNLEVCELVKLSINLSIVYIQEKDIDISLSCTKTANIYVDENKFLACLVNIIKNSIEAIEDKGKIEIEILKKEESVSIKISNNGSMIPIEVQPHIFEEGYTTKKTGSGLGLPICAENIKAQNGTLKLVQSTQQNTVFEICLPININ